MKVTGDKHDAKYQPRRCEMQHVFPLDLSRYNRVHIATHNTAVFFIIHFLHLQAVGLKEKK